ncbi:MAG: hypothetical protein CMI02_14890 [Oceanospirillaceae bacterium]|nr:hypothetical protein [Oceanospirillaceae bacterium]
MAEAKPVLILDVIKARLARITTANGYHSDAGADQYEGYLAQALAEDARSAYPFIALQPGVDQRVAKTSGGTLKRRVNFHLVVVDRLVEGITTTLLNHAEDVIRAVADKDNTEYFDGHAVNSEVMDIDYQIPEMGGAVAWAAVQIAADYTLDLKP